MSAPEIFVEKTNRGVRIVNKSNKKIKVVTVTLIDILSHRQQPKLRASLHISLKQGLRG